jgi:predicted Zn-dependent peptidase
MNPSLHVLPNGVRVVCDPTPELQTLAATVVAGHGARSEPQDRSGWAHLLEHMVFKGAGSRSAMDIVETIEAQGGSINAATGYERTSFQVRALKGGLRLALEVMGDLVLRPTLDPAELEREKGVIAQEIAEAADDPDDLVFELAQTAAFPGQSIGRPILGTVKSLADARRDTLDAWRAGLYAAPALVVSVSGAVDEDDLLKAVEDVFGAAGGAPLPEAAPARFVGGRKGRARALEQSHLVFLLPAVGAADDDYYVQRVFAEALGGGMASRLFQEAREKRGLAYSIDAYSDNYAETGLLGIYAGCAAHDAEDLARVCAEQVLDLAGGMQPDELARAKAQLKAHMFMSLESPLARAEGIAGQVHLFGRPLSPAEMAQGIDAVSAADVARFRDRMLGPGTCAVSVLGPKRALGAGEAFRQALFEGG